jgi:hypothetical protein
VQKEFTGKRVRMAFNRECNGLTARDGNSQSSLRPEASPDLRDAFRPGKTWSEMKGNVS